MLDELGKLGDAYMSLRFGLEVASFFSSWGVASVRLPLCSPSVHLAVARLPDSNLLHQGKAPHHLDPTPTFDATLLEVGLPDDELLDIGLAIAQGARAVTYPYNVFHKADSVLEYPPLLDLRGFHWYHGEYQRAAN